MLLQMESAVVKQATPAPRYEVAALLQTENDPAFGLAPEVRFAALDGLASIDANDSPRHLPGRIRGLIGELKRLAALPPEAIALEQGELRACERALNALHNLRKRQRKAARPAAPASSLPLWSKRDCRSWLLGHAPKCVYCRRTITEPDATIDHITPKEQGGLNLPQNYALACKSCNGCKGNRTPQEWAADILAGEGQAKAAWEGGAA